MLLRRSFLFSGVLFCVATGLTSTAPAQQVDWTQVAYPAHPSGRSASGITYDPATASMVLFGGADGNSVLGDTWIWDGAWRPKFPASSPAARQGPAIAFDGAAGNVVLFGGAPTVPVGNGTAFGDTWTWDGVNWTQQFPPVSPPARTWSNMVYVPGTRTVLLFSGTNTPNGDDALADSLGLGRSRQDMDRATPPCTSRRTSDESAGLRRRDANRSPFRRRHHQPDSAERHVDLGRQQLAAALSGHGARSSKRACFGV